VHNAVCDAVAHLGVRHIDMPTTPVRVWSAINDAADGHGTAKGDAEMQIDITVNGTAESHDVEARTLLVYYLRDAVGLKGTNVGCDTTSCGACTVLLNGESVKSCTVLAAQVAGEEVTTIEDWPWRTGGCTRSSRPSRSATGCSAATARREW